MIVGGGVIGGFHIRPFVAMAEITVIHILVAFAVFVGQKSDAAIPLSSLQREGVQMLLPEASPNEWLGGAPIRGLTASSSSGANPDLRSLEISPTHVAFHACGLLNSIDRAESSQTTSISPCSGSHVYD